MNKLAATAYLAFLVIGSSIFIAEARPAYAQKENRPCGYCHVSPSGGDQRNFRGQYYGANGLSFLNFDEAREAALAGVEKDSSGASALPKTRYVGNVGGPAASQIQLASLRGPVVVFYLDAPTEATKKVMKEVFNLSVAYGKQVTFIGVTTADAETALKMTADYGSVIRILPDKGDTAVKKFSLQNGFDFAVVAKMGDPLKTFSGLSKANIDEAIKVLATQEIAAPTFDTAKFPETPVRGSKRGG